MGTSPLQVDVAIIGAGTAGMSAYKAARKHTDRIVVIEKGPYGTMCARVGCMPSKLLIAASEAARAVRGAPVFGVYTQGLQVNGEAVMQRLHAERARFVQAAVDDVLSWPAQHLLRGHARFTAPRELVVSSGSSVQTVQARATIIATGTTPTYPAAWKAALGERMVVNDDIFSWTTLPPSVAIVGTGVIGLEMAQALQGLGVKVLLVGRSEKIGPLTAPALQSAARQLVSQDVETLFNAQVTAVQLQGEQVELSISQGDTTRTEQVDYLLVATGRHHTLEALNIEQAGVVLDDKGRPQIDRQTRQVQDLPIFMAGDANGVVPLQHEASDDGFAAGNNAAHWPDTKAFARRTGLSIVFSHPQMMIAGQSHALLTRAGADFVVGSVDFANQGRASIMGANRGLLQLYADRASQRLLGAEMLGPSAEHFAHLLAWSVQQQATISSLLAMPFYHPALEEGLRTALQDARRQLR
ncbi:MAG: dihydrolipoyl dehydrogenase [Comamonas sp.]